MQDLSRPVSHIEPARFKCPEASSLGSVLVASSTAFSHLYHYTREHICWACLEEQSAMTVEYALMETVL